MNLLSLITPDTIKLAASLLAAGLPFLLHLIFKDRADKAAAVFETGVRLAYDAVTEVQLRTGAKVDDKVSLGLGYLRDYLAAHGTALSEDQIAKAKLTFQALHGQEKAMGA